MSEAAVTVRVRKFMRNPLLKRRQMVIEHLLELSSRLLKSFILSVLLFLRKISRIFFARNTTLLTIRLWFSSVSKLLLVLYCFFHYVVGGGRSTGFALIYDSVEDVKKFEAKYRLARVYSYCFYSFSSVSWSTTDLAVRCSRKRRTIRRRSGVLVVVLLFIRLRRLKMIKLTLLFLVIMVWLPVFLVF